MHFKKEQDYKAWVATQEKGAIGGGLLTPQGGEDYVGAIPAIRAVIYFKEGYSDEMREAIAQCFDDYQVYAKAHLTWLWQGEPPKSESASNTFNKVKPIRKILNNYTQMKELSLLYTSGIEKFATGAWEFFVSGRSQWQAQKKNYQSTLTFSMPIEWVGENSKAFIDLF
ncbi:type VI immunity family protein, partial [Acinetobacter bereziniae]